MTDRYRFPDGFLWGAATSAYQIEGSPLADGAGHNIWHRFARTPGRTANGESGEVACDHYRRYADDVALMADLGLAAYRFSLAWARLLPDGTGRVNPGGVAFYDRLIDALLARGITPVATLFHWDLPVALDDRGGWLNPESADWFAEYTQVAVRAYGDRVKRWATLNEPWVVSDGGYLHGALAPGHRNIFEAPLASINLMRAHGAGVQAFRATARDGEIGLVVNLEPKVAASDSASDVAAVRRADAYMNRQYLDPALLGSWPAELAEIFGEAWPTDVANAALPLICQPIDFVGVNWYTRGVTRHDPGAWPVYAAPARQPQHLYTDVGWEVYAPALTDTLIWVTERYGRRPIYITENGAALQDPPVARDGRVQDPLRVDYLRDHLIAAHDAIARGVDLRGYFAWSLLDNYEWSLGFSKRFGIVHVNYQTQERTPKDSARFYREVIRSHGRSLDAPP
ncbi:MAG: GH1 family beta-glucosidase [Gemmatimonadaceae bacterium]|jgi:beta-glucosidase|nr:GH1 family beta-glucosidase [Gemmatimonadaceae bacterium]